MPLSSETFGSWMLIIVLLAVVLSVSWLAFGQPMWDYYAARRAQRRSRTEEQGGTA